MNNLPCDICGMQLMLPVVPGISQLRCPEDDFEYTYDNDLKHPIEKMYYAKINKIEFCVEVNLLENISVLRIIRDKENIINDDLVIWEEDYVPNTLVNYQYFKQLYQKAKDKIPKNPYQELYNTHKDKFIK